YVGLASVAHRRPKTFSLGMSQRLGLAAALLGDPHTLILDEPANGLDPQGITWLRNFLKDFAAGGRTVFVSSHLLAEMALMADHLGVIGKGRLIAAGPVDQFTRSSASTKVVVRAPESARLADVLRNAGVTVQPQPDGALHVTGREQAEIGELAFKAGIVVHELMTRVASLEEVFLEVTRNAGECVAHDGAAALPPEVWQTRSVGAPPGVPTGVPVGAPYGPVPGQPPGPSYGPPPNPTYGPSPDAPPEGFGPYGPPRYAGPPGSSSGPPSGQPGSVSFPPGSGE